MVEEKLKKLFFEARPTGRRTRGRPRKVLLDRITEIGREGGNKGLGHDQDGKGQRRKEKKGQSLKRK